MRELFLVMLVISAPFLVAVFLVHYFRYRTEAARVATANAKRDPAEDAELRRRVDRLQERVEVLEAIVTDSKYDLGRKIAGL